MPILINVTNQLGRNDIVEEFVCLLPGQQPNEVSIYRLQSTKELLNLNKADDQQFLSVDGARTYTR